MEAVALILGIFAVIIFVFACQIKRRWGIIAGNVLSRFLYIAQYALLGAWEGAVLDTFGMLSALFAWRKNGAFMKKHARKVFVLVNAAIVAISFLTYKNIFSIAALFAVVMETGALWLDDMKKIRLLTLFSAPWWLVYNVANAAYGSVLGNALTIISVIIAIYRYDIRKEERKNKI